MPVDRGGLRYPIFLQDKFTRTSQKFRNEMRKNRASFRQFRGDMRKARTDASLFRKELGGLNRDLGKLQTARARAADAGRGSNARELAEARRVQALAKERETQAKTRAKILKTMRSDEAAHTASQSGTTARQTKALRTNEKLRKRNLKTQKAITRSTQQTAGAANRVAFTFRRLFGILAAFQAARAVAGGFTGLIRGAIQFNREVEDSQISLASLFITTGQIRNEQGKLVKGAKAFSLAQGEARRQSQLLRQDSLKTVATYGELLKAFQAGVGPGLAAGLHLDEIREVTIRVSQAAAALAIPQNQLIEEIRSLLRGTIQPRTTIVASVLGITNEDIKRTKEAGTLFTFLQSKLDGFKLAAVETEKTITGLLARINDAFLFTSGTAAIEFIGQLRGLLLDVFTIIVDIKRDAKGALEEITPNPETVELLQALFDGLALAVAKVRAGLQNLRLDEVKNVAGGLGVAFATAADVFVGAIQGIISALSDAVRLAAAIGRALGIEFDTSTLQNIVFLVTKIGTFLVLGVSAVGLLKAGVALLVSPLRLVGTLMKGIFLTSQGIAQIAGALGGKLFLLAAIVFSLGLAFKNAIDKAAGFSIKLSTYFKVLKNLAVNTIGIIKQGFIVLATQIKRVLFTGIAGGLGLVLKGIEKSLVKMSQLTSIFSDKVAQQFGDAAGALRNAQRDLRKDTERTKKEADAALAKYAELKRKRIKQFIVDIDNDENNTSASDFIKNTLTKLRKAFGGFLTDALGVKIDFSFLKKAIKKAVSGGAEEGAEEGAAEVQPKLELKFTKVGQFLNQIIFDFEQGLNILRTAITSFANFVSQAIVDAFDPTKEVDIVERFARLLQQIAQQIIRTLIQVAIARALLGFGLGVQTGSFGGFFGAAQSPAGRAEGGPIDGKPVPVFARPKGLDPSDTIPIWAADGEFMQRASAVKKYGLDIMDRINRGLIDPGALRALAGLKGIRSMKGLSNKGPGFATGGAVSAARAVAAAQPAASDQGGASAQPATLFFGEREMERALSAGAGKAMNRWLRENNYSPNT